MANIGHIITWSGASIPENWHICDGTGGTPDLRGKFIYGKTSEADSPTSGGATSHTHAGGTVSTAGSSHTHSTSVGTGSVGGGSKIAYASVVLPADPGHTHSANITLKGFTAPANPWAHTHSVSLVSSDATPPYVLLYYIMKVS